MSKPRRSAGSWRNRQERDPFVQKARQEGWRSRAVYKLSEILEKERLLKPGMSCVDLGAAPGGWSQYLSSKLEGRGRIIALDLLPIDTISGVDFIQGDFTEEATIAILRAKLGDTRADLVLSDMAPNISGNKVVDQPRSMYLAELALDLARQSLKANGSFICKVFQGQGFDEFIRDARKSFGIVKTLKPKASRAGSSEMYLVARNYHLV